MTWSEIYAGSVTCRGSENCAAANILVAIKFVCECFGVNPLRYVLLSIFLNYLPTLCFWHLVLSAQIILLLDWKMYFPKNEICANC